MSDKKRKSEYLLSEIGGIDESFVSEAESYHKKRNPVWLKPLVACACACVLIIGALGIMMGTSLMAKGEAAMDFYPENNMSIKGDSDESDEEKADNISGLGGELISEGRLYFHTSRKSALLVTSKGGFMWLHADSEDFFEGFDSGDYVKVGHGAVMESYPEQTYVEGIILIEDGDIYSFTDGEWEGFSWIFSEPPER